MLNINTAAVLAGNTVTLDAASISNTALTLTTAAANTTLFTEDVNVSNWTLAGATGVTLGDGVDLTVSNLFLTGVALVTILGNVGVLNETFTVNAATTTSTINLSTLITSTNISSITANAGNGGSVVTSGSALDATGDNDATRGKTTINLAGGVDTVRLQDLDVITGDGGVLGSTVNSLNTGFDRIAAVIGNDAQNAGFLESAAANTAITVGANSVLEVNSIVDQLVFVTAANARALAKGAFGDGAAADDSYYTVVMYGNGNAYVWGMNFDQQAAAGLDNFDGANLLGVITGVAANSLSAANFA